MTPFSPAYTPVIDHRELRHNKSRPQTKNAYDTGTARERMAARYLPKVPQPVKNITKPSQI
jgi:hypothetical protein